MIPRFSKIALTAAVALYLLLVVFNNLTDYGSNYAFVRHVLSMDTTFEGNNGRWRALTASWIHHAAYAIIIVWEAAAALIIGLGTWKLWQQRAAPATDFNRAKHLVVLGLTLNLLQWFVAFITIGGEWFLMWQSRVWNGQDAAFRMFACVGLILLYLVQRDEDT